MPHNKVIHKAIAYVYLRTRESKSATHYTTLQWQIGNISCHTTAEHTTALYCP